MTHDVWTPRRRWPLLLCLTLLWSAGCSQQEPPQTIEQLYEQERGLPKVYLEAETGEQVIAPGEPGVLVRDGKIHWPALTCTNPDCPAAGRSEPVLFADPIPGLRVEPDGSLGYGRSQAPPAGTLPGNCPECLTIRDLASETAEDRQRYQNFVHPYVLPETKQRRAELATARQARQEELRKRMSRETD